MLPAERDTIEAEACMTSAAVLLAIEMSCSTGFNQAGAALPESLGVVFWQRHVLDGWGAHTGHSRCWRPSSRLPAAFGINLPVAGQRRSSRARCSAL